MHDIHDCVQRAFSISWPPHDGVYNDTRLAPPLSVVAASAGRLPSCALSDAAVMFVHLTGHLRTFGNHTGRLIEFLDASAACWFVVLVRDRRIELATFASSCHSTRPWHHATSANVPCSITGERSMHPSVKRLTGPGGAARRSTPPTLVALRGVMKLQPSRQTPK